MNGNSIITKRNELISSASYRMTHYEQLLILSALSIVDSRKQISPNKLYEIDLRNLSQTSGIDHKKFYGDMKKSCLKLFERKVSIPLEDGSILLTRFIQAIKYHDGEAKVSIQFSEKIIPYISNLKDCFVLYKFNKVAKFKSTYSVRLYELLIQRIDISNIRVIELDYLRNIFQLGKSYQSYSNIKLKVITPAIKDINTHSDINVFYKEVRTGRKVTALEFHIKALEPRPFTKKQIEQEALPGETYNEAKNRLKEKKEPKKTPFWKKLFK